MLSNVEAESSLSQTADESTCRYNQSKPKIGHPMSDATEKNKADEALVESETEEVVRSVGDRIVGFAKSLLRIAALAYALVIILMVTFESRLVYPGAYMNVPAQTAPGVTAVAYNSNDGTQLSGQLYEVPSEDTNSATPTILFFHGNGVTASYETGFIEQLGRRVGANVMAAEYRGYGSVDGKPAESGIIADAIAARDFLCDRYDIAPSELILYGQSLGGGCAVAVAGESGAKLLVLDRTFDRMVDVAAQRYWYIPVRWLMQNRYDSLSRIENYDGPLLQVHGTTDRLIPIAHAERLHAAAPSIDKTFLKIEGMGHNDSMPLATRKKVIQRIKRASEN